jgi:acetyl-CoA C-acetyltransferase/acetyl-CoA acyltransferase
LHALISIQNGESMPEAVIIGGVRTPFVKAGGPMRFVPAQELGRLATRELLYRLELAPSAVDELIAGNVASPIDAANVGRVIALNAGIPQDRVAHTVSRNCASGFECVTQAVERVRAGLARTVVAVGVDSMSNVPVCWSRRLTEHLWQFTRARSSFAKLMVLAGVRPRDLAPEIGVKSGLTDPVSGLMMGETAEKIAREMHISREEQDSFALTSHQKAAAAWSAGRLADEVLCVYPEPDLKPIAQDIGPRADQSMEALGRLKPYFDPKYGSVTVGNSCQVTDGAAAVLVMEEAAARAAGYRPLGRIRSYAYAGCDPARMGLGPVFATARALAAAKLQLADMDLVELNEAFAAQLLGCLRAFRSTEFAQNYLGTSRPMGDIDLERLNVNGGAIALGHPVGATGTRLVLTLLRELQQRNQSLGLATLCVGGGQGGAIVVERNSHDSG